MSLLGFTERQRNERAVEFAARLAELRIPFTLKTWSGHGSTRKERLTAESKLRQASGPAPVLSV